MKKQQNSIFILGSVLFLLLCWLANPGRCDVQEEVENEREFEYAIGSEHGPENWGELKEEWATCKNGKLQSPIDMANERVRIIPESKDLFVNYKPSNAHIKNRGHDISVRWKEGEAGFINISGKRYYLKQCHWHSPSEHSINGKRLAMELHMVHSYKDQEGKDHLAAVGVLFKVGAPDPFLAKLTRNISALPHSENEDIIVEKVDPREINGGSFDFYRYIGSLTTPPCTEGVIWTISKQVRTVSKKQIKMLRDAVHDHAKKNARPVQAHNKREIHVYGN